MNKTLRIVEPIVLALVPIVLVICAALEIEHTALLTLLVVTASLVPFFLRFERERPRPRDIMPVVVLSAIAAAGRLVFAPFPNIKPVSAIVIIGGASYGRQSGFLIGALAALASNMFFGQGPWTPWQMYAWGLMGYGAGVLAEKGLFDKGITPYAFGFAASFLYGFVLDSWYLVGFVSPITPQSALVAYGAGLPMSLMHAVSTVVFLLVLYLPWSKKITRIKTKYGIISKTP